MTVAQKNTIRAFTIRRRCAMENTAHQMPMENIEYQKLSNQRHSERSEESSVRKEGKK